MELFRQDASYGGWLGKKYGYGAKKMGGEEKNEGVGEGQRKNKTI